MPKRKQSLSDPKKRRSIGRPTSAVARFALSFDLDTLAWSCDFDPILDLAYYRQLMAAFPGPVLEAGCGSGRLLLQYLAEGVDIDGLDLSPSMLKLCEFKAQRADLKPKLYLQPIQSMSLPRRYSLIYLACGTLMCITNPTDVINGLRRLKAHLNPGGALAVCVFRPDYMKQLRGRLPSRWEPFYAYDLPAKMGRLTVDWRATGYEERTRVVQDQCRYRLISDNEIRQEEISSGAHRLNSDQQVIALLKKAGFSSVHKRGGYGANGGVANDDDIRCFVAT